MVEMYCQCQYPTIRCDHLGCRCEACGLPEDLLKDLGEAPAARDEVRQPADALGAPDTALSGGEVEALVDRLIEAVEKACEHPTLNLHEELVQPARTALLAVVRSSGGGGEEKKGASPVGVGLSQVEPASVLNPSDFDPSREAALLPVLREVAQNIEGAGIIQIGDPTHRMILQAVAPMTYKAFINAAAAADNRLSDLYTVSAKREAARFGAHAPGIETEGQNPKGSGAKHESPIDEVEALTPTPARQEEGSRGNRLAPEVQARIHAGRSRDGWEAWAPTPSHVLRIALRIDDEAVALLEAFSISGPWYANADAPDGTRHRLGAGSSLAGAVQWCERITGYVVTEDAPTPDANSGGEAPSRDELARAAFFALHAEKLARYEYDEPFEEAAYDWSKPENLTDIRRAAYAAADSVLAARLSAAPHPSQEKDGQS